MVVPQLPDEIWDKIHRYRCENELKTEEDLEYAKASVEELRWEQAHLRVTRELLKEYMDERDRLRRENRRLLNRLAAIEWP